MKFTKEKLALRIRELAEARYQNRKALSGWTIHEDITKEEKYPPKEVPESANELKVNTLWEGRDRYFWILGEVEVPTVAEEDDFLLLFDFGKSSGGNNSGFEAQCYINEEVYQAVDGNHKEVFIDKQYEGQTIQVALRLWGGLEGGGAAGKIYHQMKYADQAILSSETDDLFYTARVVLETVHILEENDPVRVKLLSLLNDAFLLLDWSYKESPSFYQSVQIANAHLQEAIDNLEKYSDINVTMVGHTHIDVAWLWRLKHTREKSARSFSTVLRLMEQYPEYIFLQSQPQLYDYIKQDYPEIYEKIKEKVKEGRWEIDGAMWLEPDCNLPSGESLVRQILLGSRFIKEEFDKDTKYLWLPDVFGYSWALPQILKKSGIEMFMTTKISWNQFNRMPNDTFIWKGIDGTEIPTHFITTPSPNDSDEFASYTYNGDITPFTVKGVYDTYRDKDINQNLLISYGYGDGGGGVNRRMLEMGRRIDKLPGLPNLKTGTAGEYFDELLETIKEAQEKGKYVHTWDGELYLEYHRGTYTSQARNKLWNRKLELAYRNAEIFNSWLLKTEDHAYPGETLTEGWRTILRNQFHDIIPGSSINEVYVDSEIEYAETEELVNGVMEESLSALSTKENTWTVMNTAAWNRDEYITIDGLNDSKGHFEDDFGNTFDSVSVDGKEFVRVTDVPAFGTKVIRFVEDSVSSSKKDTFEVSNNRMETPFYTIEWNDNGELVSVFDKDNHREVITPGGTGNTLQLFEDKPMNFDAWDIDIYYQEKGRDLQADSVEVKEVNELFAQVEFNYSFGTSTLKQLMTVYRDSRRIDFKTEADWKERQQLLKVKYDVDVRTTEATYDIQFGNAKRPTHWNTSWDMAKFETVGHQWVDLSEQGYGVSLLNDCKYGHDIKDGTVRLSLLKGAISPDPKADIGEHTLTYSLYPHEGTFLDGGTVPEAWSLNDPLSVHPGEWSREGFFEVESDYPVMVDAVKKAEDDDSLIVRLHDYTGGRQKVVLKPSVNISQWSEVNMVEKDIPENSKNDYNSEEGIVLNLKPYEVKTLKLES